MRCASTYCASTYCASLCRASHSSMMLCFHDAVVHHVILRYFVFWMSVVHSLGSLLLSSNAFLLGLIAFGLQLWRHRPSTARQPTLLRACHVNRATTPLVCLRTIHTAHPAPASPPHSPCALLVWPVWVHPHHLHTTWLWNAQYITCLSFSCHVKWSAFRFFH